MALSLRAQQTAAPATGSTNPIWTVIQDLYDVSTNPSGYISLGVAENMLMHDSLLLYTRENVDIAPRAFTYGDGGNGSKRLRAAMASFLTRHLHPVTTIQSDHITVTNGCSTAIEHMSWTLANPGEAFLLGQPYYGAFIPDIELRTGAKVVPVPFHGIDPLGFDAVAKYEEALLKAQASGLKVRGVVLCNPHNPLGRCYTEDTIVGLMKLCEKHDMHLISDEIYALSVWPNALDAHPPPTPFRSALSIPLEGVMHPSRLHVLWGMSKDFGANGLRIGAVITQANAQLSAALGVVSIYSYASSLSEHVTAKVLEDEKWVEGYVAENQRRLAKHYEIVVEWARANGVRYAPGANAGFFLWVDLGSAYRARHAEREVGEDIDEVLMQALLGKKVFLASGKNFGSEEPGWLRIVFSNEEEYLRLGLQRVIEALDG